jgi:hypothetical protein
MKDIWGETLVEGLEVALKAPNSRYDYFVKGVVVGFTPKMVRVFIYPGQSGDSNGQDCTKNPSGLAIRNTNRTP